MCGPLNVKRLAAAATPLLVGVAEGKPVLQLLLDVIHFGAENEHDRFRIDQDRDPLVFDDLVEFAPLIGIFERVAEARATTRPHADANSDRGFAPVGEERLDALRRGVRHRQGLLSRHHSISDRELSNTGTNQIPHAYVAIPLCSVSRLAAAASASAAKSASVAVGKRPRPMRTAAWATVSGSPSARST